MAGASHDIGEALLLKASDDDSGIIPAPLVTARFELSGTTMGRDTCSSAQDLTCYRSSCARRRHHAVPESWGTFALAVKQRSRDVLELIVDVPDEVRLANVLTDLALALLSDKTLKADLERLARVACLMVSDCSGASVSMLVDGEPSTVAVTDRVALQMDLVQYDNNEGPCVTALTGEAIRIGYAPTDQRFPHFAIGAADRRVLSVLSTPAIDHGDVVGSLNIYSQRENAFDEQDRSTAAIIAAEIANALMKSTVLSTAHGIRDQLQEQHDELSMVSMAKGVLMSIHDCSLAQAADLIRNAASDNNEPLINTAERILDSVQRDRNDAQQAPPAE